MPADLTDECRLVASDIGSSLAVLALIDKQRETSSSLINTIGGGCKFLPRDAL